MEKLGFKNTLLSAEKINNYVNEIKKDSYCNKFINDNQINDVVIENSLLVFQHLINDRRQCQSCPGLKNCPKNLKGLNKILEFIDGKIIETLVPCEYLQQKNKLANNYLVRDFDSQYLDCRLSSNDIDVYRESVVRKMGTLINGKEKKGLYVYGKTGVGKSYLSICLANRLVDQNKSVAYVNARTTIATLRGYVINDKEAFENLMNKLKNAELLIIDDLGNEKITDWSRDSVLYEILDYRLRNRLNKVIINSNYSLNELKELYKVDNEVRTKRFIELIRSICDDIELVGLNRFL